MADVGERGNCKEGLNDGMVLGHGVWDVSVKAADLRMQITFFL